MHEVEKGWLRLTSGNIVSVSETWMKVGLELLHWETLGGCRSFVDAEGQHEAPADR